MQKIQLLTDSCRSRIRLPIMITYNYWKVKINTLNYCQNHIFYINKTEVDDHPVVFSERSPATIGPNDLGPKKKLAVS